MRLSELTAYAVRIPLRKEFRHASHTRVSSDNLLLRCELANGIEGWGEGVPRPYVTGETVEGSFSQLSATRWGDQLDRDCESWQDVFELCAGIAPTVEGEDPRGCRANALRCAIELSVLDAFARLFGQPLSAVTNRFAEAEKIRATNKVIRYSGGVTSTQPRKAAVNALKMRIFGFEHCKVKVGVPGADDRTRLKYIRACLGRSIDIRLDANEAWSGAEAYQRLEPLMQYGISCVEQPVPHDEVAACAELRRNLPVDLMLDESLTSLSDGERAIHDQTCDVFNIRLSKCGGYLSCLRLAVLAQAAGLGYQLGCHPGETGVLSAAGRHFAASVADIRYREGSYDGFLLRDNVIRENITFGYGGRARPLPGSGLGVTIEPGKLQRLALRRQTYKLT